METIKFSKSDLAVESLFQFPNELLKKLFIYDIFTHKNEPQNSFLLLSSHCMVQLDTVYVDYRIIDLWHLQQNLNWFNMKLKIEKQKT